MVDIQNWDDIKDDFQSGLLLGNGSSIAVDDRFAYSSLFSAAQNAGRIGPALQKVFDHLDTKDFELVLRMLWHTTSIQGAFGVVSQEIDQAYLDLRNALVETVREHHAEYEDVEDRLPAIARFLKRFKVVASLNYDLLAYWAMMKGNRTFGPWLKDGFAGDDLEFYPDWRMFLNAYGNATGATLVVYPHGNLAILRDLLGSERKVAADLGENLIETVGGLWQGGDGTPLFVAEGTSEQKMSSIRRSEYLNVVNQEVLQEIGDSLVILGWALGDNDAHIMKALRRGSIRRVAVSIHVGSKTGDDLEEEMEYMEGRVQRRIGGKRKICFFDANSPGVWVNA